MFLVTQILLSKANYLKCSIAAFMVPLYGFYMDLQTKIYVLQWHKALRKVWNVPPQTNNKTIVHYVQQGMFSSIILIT